MVLAVAAALALALAAAAVHMGIDTAKQARARHPHDQRISTDEVLSTNLGRGCFLFFAMPSYEARSMHPYNPGLLLLQCNLFLNAKNIKY